MKNINRKVRLQAFCNAIEFYYGVPKSGVPSAIPYGMLPKLDVSSEIPAELQTLIVEINDLPADTIDLTTMRQRYKQLKKEFESQKIVVPAQPTQEFDDDTENESTPLIPPTVTVYLEVPKLKVLEAIYSAEQMHKELKALELNDYEEEGDYEFAGKKRTAAEMQAFKQHFSEEKYISDMTPSTMWKWYQFAYADPGDTTAHYAVMGRKVHPHIIAYRKARVREWAAANELPAPQILLAGGADAFYQQCMGKTNLGDYLPPAVATYRDGMKGNPFSSHHYREIETTKEDGTIEKKKELVLIQQRSGLVVPMHMIKNKSFLIPAFIKKWRDPDNYQEVLEATKENILDQLRQAIIERDRHTINSKGVDFPFLLQNLMNLGNEPEGVGALTEKILLQAIADLRENLANENERIKLLQRMGVPNLDLKPTLAFSWQPVKTSGKVMGVLFSPLQAGWRYLKKKMPNVGATNSGVLFRIDQWLGQGKYKLLEKPKGNSAEVDKLWQDYQLSSYEKGFPRDTIIKAALEINMYHLQGGGSSSSCKSGKDRRYAVKITADALAELYATYPDFSLTPTDPQKTFTATINGKKFDRATAFDLLEWKVAELFIEKRGTLVSELNAPGAEGIKGLADMLGKDICSKIDSIAKHKKLPHSQDESYVKYLKESSSFNKLEMGLGKKILKRFKGDLAKNDIILSDRLKAQVGVYPYRPSAELIESAQALLKEAEELKKEASSLIEAAKEPENLSKKDRLLKEVEKLVEECDEALDKAEALTAEAEPLVQQENESYNYTARIIREKNPDISDNALHRAVEAQIAREKVAEILSSGLKPGNLKKAQDALYEGAYPPGAESTKYRERFLAFLEKRLADPSCPTYPDDPPHKDAKAAAASMKALIGLEGIKLYEAAVKEESKTRAYRDAVFLAATQHVKGEKWTKKLILWIGGSSAIGKSFVTKLAMKGMLGFMSRDADLSGPGNYIVARDGGIEREVCHMKKAVLQLARDKKYSGIKDVMKHTDLHMKSKVKKAVDQVGLSVAIPDTFANPLNQSKKLKEMQAYSEDPDVIQAFVEIKPGDSDEARNAVKLCCKIQGESRAYDENPKPKGSIDLHSDEKLAESKDYNPEYYEYGRDGSRKGANFFKSLISEEGKNFIITNEIHPVFISYNPLSSDYEETDKKGIRMDAADWKRAQAAWEGEKDDLLDIEKPKWLKKWVRRNIEAVKLKPEDIRTLEESKLVKEYLAEYEGDASRAIKAAIADAKKSEKGEKEVYQKMIALLTGYYLETTGREYGKTPGLSKKEELIVWLKKLKERNPSTLGEKDKKLLNDIAEYNLTHHTDKIILGFNELSPLDSHYNDFLKAKAKAILYGLLAQYQTYAAVQAKLEQADFLPELDKETIKTVIGQANLADDALSGVADTSRLVINEVEAQRTLLDELADERPAATLVASEDDAPPSFEPKPAAKKAKDQDKKDAQSIIGLFYQALKIDSENVFDERYDFGKKVEISSEQVKTYVVFKINYADRQKEFQYYWNVLMHLKESGNGEAFYAVGLGLKQCFDSLDKKIKLKPAQKEILDFFQRDQVKQMHWLRKNKLSIPLELLKNKTPGAEAKIETCVLVGEAVSQAFQASKGKHLSQEASALQAELKKFTESMQTYVGKIKTLESEIDDLLNAVNYWKNEDSEFKKRLVQALRDKLKPIKKDYERSTQEVHIKSKLELLEAKITAANYLLEASSDIQAALGKASADLELARVPEQINNLTKVIYDVLEVEQEKRPLMNLNRFMQFIQQGGLASPDAVLNKKITELKLIGLLKKISENQEEILAAGSNPRAKLVEDQITLILDYVKVYDELRFFHKIDQKNIEEDWHLKIVNCLNTPELFLTQLSTHAGVSEDTKARIGDSKKELDFNRTIVDLFSSELDFQKKMDAFSGGLDVALTGVKEFKASIQEMIKTSEKIQALKTLEHGKFDFSQYLVLVAEQQKNIRQYKIRLTVVQSAGVDLPMADVMYPVQMITDYYPKKIRACMEAANTFQPDLYALGMLEPVKEQVTAFNAFQKLIDDELLPKRKAFLDPGVSDETLQAAFLKDLIYAEKHGECAKFMAMERVALKAEFSGASAEEKSALLVGFTQCMEEVSVANVQRGKELLDGFITDNLESIKSLAKADVESGNEKGDQKFIAVLKGAVKEEYQVWCRHFDLSKQWSELGGKEKPYELMCDIVGFNLLNPGKETTEGLQHNPFIYNEVIKRIAYGILADEEERKKLRKPAQTDSLSCYEAAKEKAGQKFITPVSTKIQAALHELYVNSTRLAGEYARLVDIMPSRTPTPVNETSYAAALIELFDARTACYYFGHFGDFDHPLSGQDLHEYLASKVLMEVSSQATLAAQKERIKFYLGVLKNITPKENEEAFVALQFALSSMCTQGELKKQYKEIIKDYTESLARAGITRKVVSATNSYLQGKCFEPLFSHELDKATRLGLLSPEATAALSDLQSIDKAMATLGGLDKASAKNALQARFKNISELGTRSLEDILSVDTEVKVRQDAVLLTGKEALDAVLVRLTQLEKEPGASLEKIETLKEKVKFLQKAIEYTDNYKDVQSIENGIARAIKKCEQHQHNHKKVEFYQKLIQYLSKKFTEKVELEEARKTVVVPLDANPLYLENAAANKKVLIDTAMSQLTVDDGADTTLRDLFEHALGELVKEKRISLDETPDSAYGSGRKKPTEPQIPGAILVNRVAEYLSYAEGYLKPDSNYSKRESLFNDRETIKKAIQINGLIQKIKQSDAYKQQQDQPIFQTTDVYVHAAMSAIKARYGLELSRIDYTKCDVLTRQAIDQLTKMTTEHLRAAIPLVKQISRSTTLPMGSPPPSILRRSDAEKKGNVRFAGDPQDPLKAKQSGRPGQTGRPGQNPK